MKQKQLVTQCVKHTLQEGENATAIAGVSLFKAYSGETPLPSVYEPCLCFIAQGRKQVMLGDAIYNFQSGQYLAVSVDVPMVNLITQATLEKPYLLVKVDLQAALLTELLEQAALLADPATRPARGVFTGYVDAQTQDALLRLVTLLDTPRDVLVLAQHLLYEFVENRNGEKYE